MRSVGFGNVCAEISLVLNFGGSTRSRTTFWILCACRLLIVEVDGGQHTSKPSMTKAYGLAGCGLPVQRFWNNQVSNELDAVVEVIRATIETHPHPNLP